MNPFLPGPACPLAAAAAARLAEKKKRNRTFIDPVTEVSAQTVAANKF